MRRENQYNNNSINYRDEEYFERVARRKKIQEQESQKPKKAQVRSYKEEKVYYENSRKNHAYGGKYRRAERTDSVKMSSGRTYPPQREEYRRQQQVPSEEYYRRKTVHPEEYSRKRGNRPEEYGGQRGTRWEEYGGQKVAQPKKKAGTARKICIGIGAFMLLLLLGAGILWFTPELKTKTIKMVLNSPFGPKVIHSVIGENYEAYVRDKNFDEMQIRMNQGVETPKGNISVALFGVDARAEDLTIGTNADSMIIVNVDADGKIRMGSVFRDTYLLTRGRNGDEIITKANSAYFRGGPVGAINMLNENWDLALTDYVVVNFNGLTNIINLLGGLRLKVTAEERDELNYHMYEQDEYTGHEYVPLETFGDDVVLTGSQVTAFSRLRSVNFESPEDGQIYTDDYGRTARQRYVLTELLAQAKEQGMLKMLQLMDQLFAANSGDNKFIQTSLDINELTAFAAQAFDMNMDGTAAFPDEEYQYNAILDSGDSIVADTLEDNVVFLHEFLYGIDNYSPTADLKNLAERIRNEVARQIY